MFRIVEIRTLTPPDSYTYLSDLNFNSEYSETELQQQKKKSRYENIMKVLKPDQSFVLVSKEVPINFFSLPGFTNLPDINISAIVGENGMGKSSLIDLMIRLINNTVYALKIGLEKFQEYHIRFVNDIFASMSFETNDGLYKITQEGNLIRFERLDSGILWEYDFNMRNEKYYGLKIIPKNISQRQLKEKARKMLSKLFYTISINYSAYGNNARELQPEYTEDYELEIDENPKEVDLDTRIWIHSIFHKNDAYQLPLVLTPYRSSGIINYNNEENLSRDRLCRLALLNPSPLEDVLEDKKPHSIVFDTNKRFSCYPQFSRNDISLVSYGLEQQIRWSYITEKQDYSRSYIMNFGYELVNLWNQTMGIDLIKQAISLNNKSAGDGNRALSYLIYKTIKIPATYNRYRQKWHDKLQKIFNSYLDEDNIEELAGNLSILHDLITSILADNSHITLKIRRTLALLIFQHYTTRDGEIHLKHFNKIITDCIKGQNNNIIKITSKGHSPFVHLWEFEELMPAPSIRADVRFILRNGGCIKSITLSSGERQMIGVLSSAIYHIYNLSSLFQEDKKNDDNLPILKYPYINLLFDEAELYFHPKFQTQFIKALLTAIAGLRISGTITSINMIFATHSPFLLSDIPQGNVLCVKDGEPTRNTLERTFCANVYDILANNFFMTSFIGDFAMSKVKQIIDRIEQFEETENSAIELRKEIEMIGDDFVRMNLLGRFDSKIRYL